MWAQYIVQSGKDFIALPVTFICKGQYLGLVVGVGELTSLWPLSIFQLNDGSVSGQNSSELPSLLIHVLGNRLNARTVVRDREREHIINGFNLATLDIV